MGVDAFASYFDGDNYIQHSRVVADIGLFTGRRALNGSIRPANFDART